ncbi:MAG: hypothetical protein AMXMBFR84_48680 [Candidatus Hydrogenedentota bacterium]
MATAREPEKSRAEHVGAILRHIAFGVLGTGFGMAVGYAYCLNMGTEMDDPKPGVFII